MLPDTLTVLHSEAASCPETERVVCSQPARFIVVTLLRESAGEMEQILEEYQ